MHLISSRFCYALCSLFLLLQCPDAVCQTYNVVTSRVPSLDQSQVKSILSHLNLHCETNHDRGEPCLDAENVFIEACRRFDALCSKLFLTVARDNHNQKHTTYIFEKRDDKDHLQLSFFDIYSHRRSGLLYGQLIFKRGLGYTHMYDSKTFKDLYTKNFSLSSAQQQGLVHLTPNGYSSDLIRHDRGARETFDAAKFILEQIPVHSMSYCDEFDCDEFSLAFYHVCQRYREFGRFNDLGFTFECSMIHVYGDQSSLKTPVAKDAVWSHAIVALKLSKNDRSFTFLIEPQSNSIVSMTACKSAAASIEGCLKSSQAVPQEIKQYYWLHIYRRITLYEVENDIHTSRERWNKYAGEPLFLVYPLKVEEFHAKTGVDPFSWRTSEFDRLNSSGTISIPFEADFVCSDGRNIKSKSARLHDFEYYMAIQIIQDHPNPFKRAGTSIEVNYRELAAFGIEGFDAIESLSREEMKGLVEKILVSRKQTKLGSFMCQD